MVRADRIFVGDAINSVSVLEVDGTRLKCVARDYSPLWPVTIDATPNGDILGANVSRRAFVCIVCTYICYFIERLQPVLILNCKGHAYDFAREGRQLLSRRSCEQASAR